MKHTSLVTSLVLLVCSFSGSVAMVGAGTSVKKVAFDLLPEIDPLKKVRKSSSITLEVDEAVRARSAERKVGSTTPRKDSPRPCKHHSHSSMIKAAACQATTTATPTTKVVS